MKFRHNLTLEEFLVISNIQIFESKKVFLVKIMEAFKKEEINEALAHFITVEADNTTLKIMVTLYKEKDNTKKVLQKIFIRFL